MSEINEQHNDRRAVAILKPQYLLVLALLGLALIVVGTFQPRFGIMGYTGFAVMGLSIIAWAVIAPEQLKAAMTGRTARYGGTALVVTVVLIIAMIAVYVLVRGLNMTFDMTERDAFSVRPEVRDSLIQIAGNADQPDVRLMTFVSAEDAGFRDRLTLLYEDIQAQTLGKIGYDFIDIDQNPLLAQEYGVTQSRVIAVTPLDVEGNPIPDLANIINRIDEATLQNEIVERVTSVNLQGNFNAYFLIEPGALQLDATDGTGMTVLSDQLRFLGYQPIQGATAAFRNPDNNINFNDAALDGEVMVIPGGSLPLADDDLAFVTDYLDNGGSMVMMAGVNTDGTATLASDPAMTDYLLENYGIAFNPDLLVDFDNAFEQNPLEILTTNLNTEHFIAQMGVNPDFRAQFLFSYASSIQLAESAPENVTITPLITTGESAYAVPAEEIVNLIQTQTLPRPEDGLYTGVLPVAVVAENTETGSRIVLLGSSSVMADIYTNADVAGAYSLNNIELSLRSIIWASDFSEKVSQLSLPEQVVRPSERPLLATSEQISTANVILVLLLPFGIMALGAFVVFLNRERVDGD